MFFIFGTPRSGTTLLAQSLNAHSEIVVPFETDFIVPMAFIYDRISDPDIGREMVIQLIAHSERFGTSLAEYLTVDDVREIVLSSEYHPSNILIGLYDRIAARAGKRLAGDKSPNDLLFLRMLIKTGTISSAMKIIHIIRDIRDVMVSLNRTGWVKDLDLYFPRFWSNSNLYLHVLFRDKREQYLLVRYEDLVRAPQEKFPEICDFLGVEFEPDMLSPQNRDPRYKEMEIHQYLYKPVFPGRIGVYKRTLDWDTVRQYEKQAKEALETFNYTLHTRTPVRRLVYPWLWGMLKKIHSIRGLRGPHN